MNLRNKKSKVYCLGGRFLAIGVLILIIAGFINRSNSVLARKIFITQNFFLSLLLILQGARQIVAEKDKKGYFNCVVGGIIFIIVLGLLIQLLVH